MVQVCEKFQSLCHSRNKSIWRHSAGMSSLFEAMRIGLYMCERHLRSNRILYMLILAFFSSSHCRLPDGQPAQSNEAQYKLFGVVEHAGDLKGGHYTASVRISETNWVHTSDSHTRPTTLEKVLSSQAFLLFYELAPAPIV